MIITQQQEDVAPEVGDVLLGAPAIVRFLIELGWPEDTDEDDVYYLRRAGWPIGSTAPTRGGKLLGSRNRIRRYVDKLARGPTAAA